MDRSKLAARLVNWGHWLTHEAHIGPDCARCISIENRYMPELGDVWENDREPLKITPNVQDAELINKLIRKLDLIEQHCLATHYGGLATVFRHRRVSEHVMGKMLENAEILLIDMLRAEKP